MPHQKYIVIFLNDAVVQLRQRIYYYDTVQVAWVNAVV